MANFVKTKISVTGIAVGIIILIPLLRSNFNAPPSFTRWSQSVSWDSFAGVPRIFFPYDAGISSAIYLEYDSTARRYVAYAAMDNNYSWAKPAVKDSLHPYLLNHEQYHFNISEIHARMMNQFIEANPGLPQDAYASKFNELERALNVMQEYYDTETNHSVNQSIQRKWEYKIDSMLVIHSGDSGLITDYYSGAQVFLTGKPEYGNGINSHEISYRYFGINKYDMTLVCVAHQLDRTNEDVLSTIEQSARSIYNNVHYPIRSFRILQGKDGNYLVRYLAEDTVNHTRLIDHWSVSRNYLFRVSAGIHQFTEDTVGYYQIAESFLNSFRATNTDAYWITKLDKDTTNVTITQMTRRKTSFKRCYTIPPGAVHGFYRGPIPYNDQWLMAYTIIDKPDSMIREHPLYVNNTLLTFKSAGPDVLYATWEEDHLKPPFLLTVGYVLKNDTTSGCRILHNQKILVE